MRGNTFPFKNIEDYPTNLCIKRGFKNGRS